MINYYYVILQLSFAFNGRLSIVQLSYISLFVTFQFSSFNIF